MVMIRLEMAAIPGGHGSNGESTGQVLDLGFKILHSGICDPGVDMGLFFSLEYGFQFLCISGFKSHIVINRKIQAAMGILFWKRSMEKFGGNFVVIHRSGFERNKFNRTNGLGEYYT